MYKTLYSVTVHPIQGDPVTFSDNDTTPGAASAVLAQLTANKDVDSTYDNDSDITHIIIPLHAVDYAEVTEQRTESEYEDDNAKNCTDGGSGGETGTLTVVNDSKSVLEVPILASEALNGTYGPLTFSTDPPAGSPFPDGYKSWAMITGLGVGASLEVPGLPIGMTVMAPISGPPITTTVPGELRFQR